MKSISPSICKITQLSGLFLLFLAISYYTSNLIFPVTGMWYLIDAQKLLAGKVLYRDVKSVIPPLFYLEFVIPAFFNIKSMFLYRLIGVMLLSLTFLVFFILLCARTSRKKALLATLVTYSVYISGPWEIFNTYLYISIILALLSLFIRASKSNLGYFIVGLSASAKITVGGAFLIGYAIQGVLTCIAHKSSLRHIPIFRIFRNFIAGSLFAIIGFITPILILSIFGVDTDIGGLVDLTFNGESKGGLVNALYSPIRSYLNSLSIVSEIYSYQGIIHSLKSLVITPLTGLGSSIMIANIWIVNFITFVLLFFRLAFTNSFEEIPVKLGDTLCLLGAGYASAMSACFRTDDMVIPPLLA